jgi:c(7)-type cytochrome triheme protein
MTALRKYLPRLTFWRAVLAVIFAFGVVATLQRFGQGLGAATNLSNEFPWGLWIGFDVMVGVGLAAGGFTVAATVHLFHIEKYEPIARPAVLTAFLGYALVGVGILFDIGLPWHIYHPIIMWNPHSVMFEVAWCVMLYLTVLGLEFSPAVFEALKWKFPLKLVHKVYVPLVVAGVLLSMMHQSSLGTLYVIMPDKLHGLWYTPWMPVFFFITAAAAGLAMTIVESYLSHRAFGHQLEDDLLDGMSRVIVVILAVFSVWKFQDMSTRGNLGLAFQYTNESVMFWGEMGMGILLPMAMLALPKLRQDRTWRFVAALLVVMGLIVNRLNVAITGMARSSGVDYYPTWQEVAITLSLVGAGIAAFGIAAKYLEVFPKSEMAHALPPTSVPALGVRGLPTAQVWSTAALWLLLAVGVGLMIAAPQLDARPAKAKPAVVVHAKVAVPATVQDLKLPNDFTFPQGKGKDGEASPGKVTFVHARHVDVAAPNCMACHKTGYRLTQANSRFAEASGKSMHETCGACHDGKKVATSVKTDCNACHQMELPKDYTYPQGTDSEGKVTFSHEKHVNVAKQKCAQCHDKPFAKAKSDGPLAAGKMHESCGTCHDGQKVKTSVESDCDACHVQ